MAARRTKARNPFHGVLDVVSEMNRIADRMTSAESSTAQQPHGHSDAWSPTIDLLADDSDLVIRCDLPGVARNDVEVSLSRGTLSIAGARSRGDDDDNAFYVQEIHYGQFRRDITLPEGVREQHIDAEVAEGVLTVRVRGAAGASGPTLIDVRSADGGSEH